MNKAEYIFNCKEHGNTPTIKLCRYVIGLRMQGYNICDKPCKLDKSKK